jgi:hypothetical protein
MYVMHEKVILPKKMESTGETVAFLVMTVGGPFDLLLFLSCQLPTVEVNTRTQL